jgi:hypothetical protein
LRNSLNSLSDYADPDGNQVELQVDHFKSAEEANGYMVGFCLERALIWLGFSPDCYNPQLSSAFSTNPIGVDYDPEEFVRKVKAGVAFEELVKRGDIGPRDARSVPQPRM